jgi:hypothetical protein
MLKATSDSKPRSWQRMKVSERRIFNTLYVRIQGKLITFVRECRNINPRDLSDSDILRLEQSHGFKIKRSH